MQAPRYFNPNNDVNSQVQLPYHTNYRNNAPPQQNFYASNRFDIQNNQYRAEPNNYFEPNSNYGYGAPEFENSFNSQK
jgi:hypothetical protein